MVPQLIAVLLLGGVSATTKPFTAKPTAQPTTEPTSATCQVLQGPPGPPGTCSYTEVNLIRGVREISTNLKESVQNLTKGIVDALYVGNQARSRSTEHRRTALPSLPCREIFQCNPSAQSGYYWLKSTTTECREVYCAMDTYCNITGGWMRLAYFNMAEPGASCPTSLRQINTPARLCGRLTAPGCSGVTYPAEGIRYSKVCGQARGYQYYSTDAFGETFNDINSYYVDGISITYGSPRRHLWTYATGLSDDDNNSGDYKYNCPCAKYPGADPPDFVGLDYYCESGITGRWQDNNRIVLEDPLWDGDGCGPDNNCCDRAGLP